MGAELSGGLKPGRSCGPARLRKTAFLIRAVSSATSTVRIARKALLDEDPALGAASVTTKEFFSALASCRPRGSSV